MEFGVLDGRLRYVRRPTGLANQALQRGCTLVVAQQSDDQRGALILTGQYYPVNAYLLGIC